MRLHALFNPDGFSTLVLFEYLDTLYLGLTFGRFMQTRIPVKTQDCDPIKQNIRFHEIKYQRQHLADNVVMLIDTVEVLSIEKGDTRCPRW